MTNSHDFSGNYLVLVPQELGAFDLLSILWSKDIERKAFVKSPEGRGENLKTRWIIFFSLFAQKILLSFAKPMSKLGSTLELWLNLLSFNDGFHKLMLRFMQGKVEIPEKPGANFISTFGYLDKRVELAKNIKSGDIRYNAALSVMASKISYENKAFVETTVRDIWKMELIGYYDFWNDFQGKRTTQAFMLHDKKANPKIIVIAFRGTELFDADAWCTDIDISWYEFPGMGKVHGGFMKALGLLRNKGWPSQIDHQDHKEDQQLAYYTIREKLKQLLQRNSHTKFILTGHSMGGALAILFPAVLAMHGETWLLSRLEGVYTFGQPRVGDHGFKIFMEKTMHKYGFRYLRFVYSNDLIPRLPTDNPRFMFKHFGTCLYYNSCYEGKIVKEEPNKNYFSAMKVIPHVLVAFWELIRSFIIPYAKGADYEETWLLKVLRVMGLLIPGLAAHNPQDYVNLTRLGSCVLYQVHLQDLYTTSSSSYSD